MSWPFLKPYLREMNLYLCKTSKNVSCRHTELHVPKMANTIDVIKIILIQSTPEPSFYLVQIILYPPFVWLGNVVHVISYFFLNIVEKTNALKFGSRFVAFIFSQMSNCSTTVVNRNVCMSFFPPFFSYSKVCSMLYEKRRKEKGNINVNTKEICVS